jgi:3-oxoacyl-[acyl-carrier protein] reductase
MRTEAGVDDDDALRETSPAELVRLARRLSGLSQAQLAAASGLPQSAVSAFEKGRRVPGTEQLQRIAAAAGYVLDLGLTRPDRGHRPVGQRVAVVTGASRARGIGAAVVRRLAADGCAVLVHGWEPHDAEQPWGADEGGAAALVEELAGRGRQVELVEADLADPSAPQAVVDAAVRRFGRLDVLVANHARSSEGGLTEVSADELDLSFAVNARATVLLVRAMAAQVGPDGGRVVLFTSGQYHGGMPGELAYVASKGAVHQVTATLAVELAPRGVTVNCVDPGPTDTGWADDRVRRAVREASPSGRWGTPEDAARLVSWLAGPDSGWVTGQVIASDGGWSSR